MVDLTLIRDAGAMIGPSNQSWWESLVSTYGADHVEAVVEHLKDETGQPVNVATADRQLRADAKQRADAEADAAEDAGQAVPPTRTSPDPAPADPPQASQPVEPAPISTSATTPPQASSPITTTPQAIPPARSASPKPGAPVKNKTLIANIHAKRGDRPITDIAKEIDIHHVTLQKAIRTGEFGPRLLPKVARWLDDAKSTAHSEAATRLLNAQADLTEAKAGALGKQLGTIDGRPVRVRVIKLDPKHAAQHATPLATADSYIDRMDALGVAISELARVHPRETAVLARLYASIADQVADIEQPASKGD